MQPDGKIVIAGGDGGDFALLRLNANGSFDNSFGSGGKVTTPIGTQRDEAHAVALQSDGKTDIEVYRDGIWYELKSGSGFYAVSFGQTGDLAVPGDYNGDGKTDEAVYRGGLWFILQSGAGGGNLNVISFGDANDKPIPNSYVQ